MELNMKIIGQMNEPVIKKELYFFYLEAGVPYEGWVDFGDGIISYALKEVEIVGVPYNKYNHHFYKLRNVSACIVNHRGTIQSEEYYMLKPGDTLSKLAVKYKVTVDDLVKWNRITDPDKIMTGQRLVVGKPSNEFPDNSTNNITKPQSIPEVAETDQWGKGSLFFIVTFFDGVSGFGTGIKQMGGSFRLTNGDYNGNKLSIKHYKSGWTGGSRAQITTYNAVKWGGSISKGATGVNLAIGTGQIVYEMSQDDWNFGYKAQHKASEVAGGSLGAWGGAVAGAEIGALLGGWGAIPGAIIGGIFGGWGGSEAGGAIYKQVKK